MQDLSNLQRKVNIYKEVLENTKNYRQDWKTHLRDSIIQTLISIAKSTGLQGSITSKSEIDNLEAIVLSLGDMGSGLVQNIEKEGVKSTNELKKHNGSLIYQQLFNGKVVVLIQYPMIQGYGEPRPPKTIGIYRPEELQEPFFVRHVEEFIKEITDWEDYDDDEPNNKIGFKFNFEK